MRTCPDFPYMNLSENVLRGHRTTGGLVFCRRHDDDDDDDDDDE